MKYVFSVTRPFNLICLILIALGFAAWQGYQLYRSNQQIEIINRLIENQPLQQDYQWEEQTPAVQIARAIQLKNKDRFDEALSLLIPLTAQNNTSVQQVVLYNLGNLYLYRAMQSIRQNQLRLAVPLVIQAKRAYQQALLNNPDFQDAKYNLEVALMLLPNLPRIEPQQSGQDDQREALWTRVPGFPRGLP